MHHLRSHCKINYLGIFKDNAIAAGIRFITGPTLGTIWPEFGPVRPGFGQRGTFVTYVFQESRIFTVYLLILLKLV